jgi:hypothetical protein
MFPMAAVGSACNYPREAYNPADLAPEYHEGVREYFRRAAYRDFLPEARTADERRGIEERAEEAASVAYLFWLTNRTNRIPRGAHFSAMAGVRRFMERSRWQGRTGQRRASRRTVTEGALMRQERARERSQFTPASVAEAVERIAKSPALGRKAYRLAKRIGLPGVRELVREACGFTAE